MWLIPLVGSMWVGGKTNTNTNMCQHLQSHFLSIVFVVFAIIGGRWKIVDDLMSDGPVKLRDAVL